jgi:hypothetical protein
MFPACCEIERKVLDISILRWGFLPGLRELGFLCQHSMFHLAGRCAREAALDLGHSQETGCQLAQLERRSMLPFGDLCVDVVVGYCNAVGNVFWGA